MKFKKPEVPQLVEMMDMILGCESPAEQSEKFDNKTISHMATFIDDNGETVATCFCSLPTAASLGCGLSMIPPGAAEAMVEDQELTATATENLYEVMNMFSSLLMDDKTSHLKLSEVRAANDSDVEVDEWEASAFSLEMGKYGNGEILFNVKSAVFG